ncbi:nickel insertion protein [Streptosporangium sp. NPDC006007]|uniref:nickel insertion protein n=1 Tax=Streptosporangium sp. NPDC006007 TaxID=3154575 RepID=UPI0033A98D28
MLFPPHLLWAVRETIVTEASTIGAREHRVGKRELAWEFATIMIGAAAVRVNTVRYRKQIVTVAECRKVVAAAGQLDIPVKTTPARSIAAAERMSSQ